MTITKMHDGSLEISAISQTRGDMLTGRVHMRYYGYTRREAIARFKNGFNIK